MQTERKKASDFPQELLDTFDLYVHGDINRREFMDRAQKYAVGGLDGCGDLGKSCARIMLSRSRCRRMMLA